MAIEDNFSNMSSQQLGTLLENANRLAGQSGKQRAEAERLLPLMFATPTRKPLKLCISGRRRASPCSAITKSIA